VGDLEGVHDAVIKGQPTRTAGRGGETSERAAGERTPASWWRFHQVAVSLLDALMLYPAWRAHAWIAAPWDMMFFFAALASAAAGATVRLHLAFTARYYPPELPAQRARAGLWTRFADATFSAALAVGALSISSHHGEIATLLMAVAIATAVAAFLIEPATARAAFRDGS
jgi:hypothetical protein